MIRHFAWLAFFAFALASRAEAVAWVGWSDSIFLQAKREHKLVILDLEAVWCHWCHVMEEKTYADASVAALLEKNFLTVRVDQDSRPDLANRYEDYGWPATIVFDGNGHELAKRAGNIPPEKMRTWLARLIAKPVAEPADPEDHSGSDAKGGSVANAGLLRQEVEREFDSAKGGWKGSHKYLDRFFVEDGIRLALSGDAQAEKRVRQTLRAVQSLLDPVWGGVYQYSVGGDWKEPHYEKIMAVQTDAILSYSLAYAAWHESEDLEAARKTESYLSQFLLGPDGAVYASQDADVVPGRESASYFALGDAERRAKGVPRVDTHAYARENGWAIEAWVRLYDVTGEKGYLAKAERAGNWLLEHRQLPEGGFTHDEKNRDGKNGPYLGDQVAAGRAFLALYASTAERKWLKRAERVLHFVDQRFRGPDQGYLTSVASRNSALMPRAQGEENISLSRFASLLHQYTGQEFERTIAQRALAFARLPQTWNRIYWVCGLLSAELEASQAPLHLTIVGAKEDGRALALHKSALAFPSVFRRIEWWDRKEGALPRGDVSYPELPEPAAFICTDRRCSPPIQDPARLREKIDRLRQAH